MSSSWATMITDVRLQKKSSGGDSVKIVIKDIKQFKKELLIQGYTQRGFARKIGISEPYANQIANGVRNPGPKITKRICEALGVQFEDFFYISDDKSNHKRGLK